MKNVVNGIQIIRAMGFLALTLVLAGCGSEAAEKPTGINGGPVLTIYSGRGPELLGPVIQKFTAATGIEARVLPGTSQDLAALLAGSGTAAGADVFISIDPVYMEPITPQFASLPVELLSKVPDWARSPSGNWIGFAGGARAFVYNSDRVKESELPKSLKDLADPVWRGRIGLAPTEIAFQGMVLSAHAVWGKEETGRWLEDLNANEPVFLQNSMQCAKATGDGSVDISFVSHPQILYGKDHGDTSPTRLHFLGRGEAGNFMTVSAAGIMSTANYPDAALQFVEFLLSDEAQLFFAMETNEYPLLSGAPLEAILPALEDVAPSNSRIFDSSDLINAQAMLIEASLYPLM